MTSYDTTDAIRKEHIAEREQAAQGAFEKVRLHDRVITVQIDNFEMLPHHSVKASGKGLSLISGTAAQSIVHNRKPFHQQTQAQSVEQTIKSINTWLDPKQVFSTRSAFISSFSSAEDQTVLNDFSDVVFGTVFQNRKALLALNSGLGYMRGKFSLQEYGY